MEETQIKACTFRLISGNEVIVLRALDGRRFISGAKKTFASYIDGRFEDLQMDKPGVETPETIVRVHEIEGTSTLRGIFSALPGVWEQKWLTQDQVIEFCEKHPRWIMDGYFAAMFLCKKNDDQPIDERNSQSNLMVAGVYGFKKELYTYAYEFNHAKTIGSNGRLRLVIVPQLI